MKVTARQAYWANVVWTIGFTTGLYLYFMPDRRNTTNTVVWALWFVLILAQSLGVGFVNYRRTRELARIAQGHCPKCDRDRKGVYTDGPCPTCGRRAFPKCAKCGRDMTGLQDRACPDCGVMYGIEWPEEINEASKRANEPPCEV